MLSVELHLDEKQHSTGEPNLGFGDIWHNMISKLIGVESIGCYINLRKPDILSIGPHPCWSESASKIEMPDILSRLTSKFLLIDFLAHQPSIFAIL